MTMELTEIIEIIDECNNIKTLKFNLKTSAVPGQFVMVWLPDIDEVPMSLSYISNEAGITVERKGKATSTLHSLRPGDTVGIRGPFGNGFEIAGPKILVVGGGSGVAPLGPLVEHAVANELSVTAAIGARSECDILFADRLARAGAVVRMASDDGSVGHHGFVSEVVSELMNTQRFDRVYACGPEALLVKCVDLARSKGVPIQVSLERYMKCGIGICGSCQIDGLTVCRDGPVFNGDTLADASDFGSSRRTASGRRVGL